MKQDRDFVSITMADLIARSAYQMGKTPLLPIFAATLGASDAFLGIIISVSTLTGMIIKPFVGVFSDRWGRRIWLLVGTALFAFMPFTYWLVQTPTQLFFTRIIHGTATAIYGPVTLAYVTERWPGQQAERLGWFGMARSAGYIVGPALAGWLLLEMEPAAIFTIIGLLSLFIFIPIRSLPESRQRSTKAQSLALKDQIKDALRSGSKLPSVWVSGGLEALVHIALYALKAFLPIFALSMGVNVALVGLFFGLQEAVKMVLKPLGGRLGDRRGYFFAISMGMFVLGFVIMLLPFSEHSSGLLTGAILLGSAQALIFPSTTALVSAQIDGRNLGAGMGLLGTLRNMGKVLGPVLGGLLIFRFDYQITFQLLGLLLLGGSGIVAYYAKPRSRMTT